jgi:hypothetical protein
LKEQVTGITQARRVSGCRGRTAGAADRSTDDLGGQADQCAGRHRAAEDHALDHVGRGQARYPRLQVLVEAILVDISRASARSSA